MTSPSASSSFVACKLSYLNQFSGDAQLPPETTTVFASEVTAGRVEYGLRHNILTPWETLAQSVAAIAPTTSPVLTIPLVFALAGNGTWAAYALATVQVTLIALLIGALARRSASPGSLYSYATDSLPPVVHSGFSKNSPRVRARHKISNSDGTIHPVRSILRSAS